HEETGLEVVPLRLIGVYSSPEHGQIVTYPDGNVIHYISSSFECRVVSGALACSHESLELGWFDPERLPADMVPMHRVRIADALARGGRRSCGEVSRGGGGGAGRVRRVGG